VYDYTCIASYRHLYVGNVGSKYGYWLLEGNECSAAGGFPSNPILSGSAPNRHTRDVKRKERATNRESEELKKEINKELEK
jgi:hypothetical protein